MGREIYCIINDMAEVLNVSQMQKLQEVLVKRLSENTVSDYLQTTNMDFLDMFLTAKHLEGCSDKTIRYYMCNIEKMLDTINIPVIKITTEMLRKYLVEYQMINNCGKEPNNFQFVEQIRNKQQQLYKRKNPPRMPSQNGKAPRRYSFTGHTRSVGRSYIRQSSARIKGISAGSAQERSYRLALRYGRSSRRPAPPVYLRKRHLPS